VRFPSIRRTETDPSSPEAQCKENMIRVDIWPIFGDLKFRSRFIEVPKYVLELESCIARVWYRNKDLDLDELVKELVQFGCGKKGDSAFQLPTILPNGIKLSDLVSDTSLLGNDNRILTLHGLESQHEWPDIDWGAISMTDDSPPDIIHSVGYIPMLNFALPASFMPGNSLASFTTARSTLSSSTYYTGNNGLSPAMGIETIREEEPLDPSMPAPLQKLRNDYYSHLREQDIVQPFDKELNWSGKGQHVVYMQKEDVPISVLSHLGASMTAKVTQVLCRRIGLARKTMRCSHQWVILDAIGEVYHLQILHHTHIVQLVGSYLQGRNFSILMYPVAECHLGTFLEDTADQHVHNTDSQVDMSYPSRLAFPRASVGCLTSAVAYIHDNTTKHMDIKPQNILVKSTTPISPLQWHVYLADFGLSRSFASQDHSQTDGSTARTPRYCATEVYQHERRGRSADIFSLGCVFIEIFTVLNGEHPQDFAEFRRGEGQDESFHANLPSVIEWIDHMYCETFLHTNNWAIFRDARTADVLKGMVADEAQARPTARTLQQRRFGTGGFLMPHVLERITAVVSVQNHKYRIKEGRRTT
jgi:hypothetical protein